MGLRRQFVLTLLSTALIACNEDNTLGLGNSKKDRFTASLSGASVRPIPVPTNVTGTVDISVLEPQVGETQRSVSFVISTANLTSANAAHIHLGGASVSDGQIIATLYTNPTDTAITSAQLVSSSVPESAFGSVGLDSLMTLMSTGAAYVDVHSTANPNGVVRGQLTKRGATAPSDVFAARVLSGTKVRPLPVLATSNGSATFELISNTTIRFNVTVTGLTGATLAHIHSGDEDSVGPILVPLFTATTPTGPLSGTLASGTFTALNIQVPGISFDSLLTLMRRSRAYVDVHTQLNPNGEIRAQIEPVSALP